MDGARRRKLREHQCREGYDKSHNGKGVKWDGENNVDPMWEWVKMGNDLKCTRSVWFSASRRCEPKKCVVE